jgi:hypothetical protein
VLGYGVALKFTYTVLGHTHSHASRRVVLSRVMQYTSQPGDTRPGKENKIKNAYLERHLEVLEVTLRGTGHGATTLSIVGTVQRPLCPDPCFILLCMPCFLCHIFCGSKTLQAQADMMAKNVAARMEESIRNPPGAPKAAAPTAQPMAVAPIALTPNAPPVVVVEAVTVVADPGTVVPMGIAAQSMDRGGDLASQMRDLAPR